MKSCETYTVSMRLFNFIRNRITTLVENNKKCEALNIKDNLSTNRVSIGIGSGVIYEKETLAEYQYTLLTNYCNKRSRCN